MKALFIGRFQPFHNGHLKVLQQIHNNYEEIIIGIGSSQYKNTQKNPFSFEERKTMITRTLHQAGITNIKIIAIPDIHDPPNWVNHVSQIISDFQVVITNNDFTDKLFQEKGYQIKSTNQFNRSELSGKEIRRKILKNEKWQHLVPKKITEYLEEINGIQRIQKTNTSEK